MSEYDSGGPCLKALHNQGAGKDGRADTFPQPPSPLASWQTLLRGAPSHVPGFTTADAWRSHGKITPTTLGNQLSGSSLPSQVPSSVLVEREGRTNRLSLQADIIWVQILDPTLRRCILWASYSISLIFKMKFKCPQISAGSSISVHLTYPLPLGSSLLHTAHWEKQSKC